MPTQIQQTHLTGGSSSGTSVNTASITPSPNRIVLVSVIQFDSGGTPNVPTVSGCGITWYEVKTSLTTNRRVTIFVGVSASPSTGALTIDFSGQSNAANWSVDQFSNTKITNGGQDAIVQSGEHNSTSASGSFGVTLSSFSNINNAAYGGIHPSADTTTPGSGFTTIFTAGGGNINVEWSPTNQASVNWTLGGTVLVCAVGLELAFEKRHGGFII